MADYDNDRSKALRLRLATVGIVLEEPREPTRELPRARAEPVAINRAAIRTILRGRGAAERDLEWLTSSCPSKAHALAFKPPAAVPRAVIVEPEEPAFVPSTEPQK